MGKMRGINTDFWTDTWVVDQLNPLDRHLFLYLLTNPQTNLIGVYQLSLRIMSFQTGIEKDELTRMLKRIEPKVFYRDGWVIMRNGIKHQNYKNSNINAGIMREAESIPSEILQHIKWPKDFGQKPPIGSNQTNIFHDSSMTQGSTKPNLTKLNTTVGDKADVDNSTTETTGLKKLDGRKYSDITAVYDDLLEQGLINEKYKAWYCSSFFKIGRERVMILASQAKADGKDPQKLFSHLISKETKTKDRLLKQ